jgi:hypothetical protein
MNNKTVWDVEKVTCNLNENGDVFYEVIEVKKYVVDLIHFGSKSSPVTGLEWPRGFQEVKVLRFLDKGTGWW